MAKTHKVQNCDHISAIAETYGFHDYDTLWQANAGLQRANPHILYKGDKQHPEGDQIQIPEKKEKTESGNTEKTHSFVVQTSGLALRLRILDHTFKPLRQCKYELMIGSKKLTGTTDGEGMIVEDIPRSAEKGSLKVDLPAPAPAGAASEPSPTLTARFELSIGALNPIQEQAPDGECVSGVQARLNNLGFHSGRVDGDRNEVTKSAIKRFKQHFGMNPVDDLSDAALQQKLGEVHDTKTPVNVPSSTGSGTTP